MKTCSNPMEFICSWEDTRDECRRSEIKSIVYGIHYEEGTGKENKGR